MYSDAMEGKPVGFSDFMLSSNRNDFIEERYYNFSYSPIRIDTGEVGGVLVTVIETTNQKKSEIALRQSEERFRTMADNIPNLAWIGDADGGITWYNKKWYDYTGTTYEEMEGWGWQSVHDPVKLPAIVDKWQDSISSGRPFEMVIPLRGVDGEFRQFLTRVLPIRNTNGEVQQWFGTNTDITEQIEYELTLKENEERFRKLAECTDILIVLVDGNGKATYFNNAWTELTGRSNNELTDWRMSDLLHPEDRESTMKSHANAFENKVNWSGEFRILDKKGQYKWLLGKAILRSEKEDCFTGYIYSFVEITERKIAEKKAIEHERNLRNTILQAPVAMCIFKGPEYVVELANQRMFDFWAKSPETVLEKSIFEGVPETKDQGIKPLLDEVYKTGNTFTGSNIPVILERLGKIETMYINLVYEAYRECDGSISRILCVVIDVTAQVVARQKIEEVIEERTKELAQANLNLQKSNAELAQFAHAASHDLQEPLRKITTFSKLLENRIGDAIDESAKTYISKISSTSERMNKLITDILAYSEIVRENEVFEKVDLNSVINSVLTDFELLIEQKGALITCDNLPAVEAIPVQMFQIFRNLISNALKFTRNDVKPIISIAVVKVSNEEIESSLVLKKGLEYYRFVFKDNGIGFQKEYSEQIFTIFKRLHSKSEYEGTGIGLAMCKKIALNHQGDLDALESTENGAVFNLILPANK